MKKLSLHIGINKYDRSYYGDADLLQCVYDAQRLHAYADERNYEAALMLDGQATTSNFQKFMKDAAKSLKKGDFIFISDSSHGTYDDGVVNGRLKRQTAICMNDRIFWDYEFRSLLMAFKTGVTIIWLADCCFAESNWRFIRGESPAKPYNGARSRYWKLKPDLIDMADNDPRLAHRQIPMSATQGDKRNIRAKVFTYSSSNIFQVSYEDDNGGVFTTSVLTALQKQPSLTYYQLWRRASEIIAPLYPQSPVFENVRASNFTGNRFLT